jgi:hypothetical protein
VLPFEAVEEIRAMFFNGKKSENELIFLNEFKKV